MVARCRQGEMADRGAHDLSPPLLSADSPSGSCPPPCYEVTDFAHRSE